jgi:hypothetical protein
MSTPVVHATWFHADSSSLKGEYAQTLGDSTSSSHFAIYFSCVHLFFASHVRHARKEIRKFFINDYGFEVMPDDLKTKLEKWGVEIIRLPNQHSEKARTQKLWLNQYFVIDIFGYQANLLEEFHLFDSDVVSMNSTPIEWQNDSQLKLLINSSNPNEKINGLQVKELSNLWNIFNERNQSGFIPYYGGEYIGIQSGHSKPFFETIENYFSKNLDLLDRSGVYAKEEAHLISIASKDFLVDANTDMLIERIWTQPWTHRYIPKNYYKLSFLHVPAEKKTGIHRLSKIAQEPNSWFWTAKEAEWTSKVGNLLGIPTYTLEKFIQDSYLLRKGLFRHIKNRIVRDK